MLIKLSNLLKVIFSSGILDGKESDMENGGPLCENYMSYGYRILVSFIMVINLLIFYSFIFYLNLI